MTAGTELFSGLNDSDIKLTKAPAGSMKNNCMKVLFVSIKCFYVVYNVY